MMRTSRAVLPAALASAMLVMPGCGGYDAGPMRPTEPTPTPIQVTANAYILPDAVSLNDWAFGDEPIVIYTSERLRWVNVDTLTHVIVADAPDATDFQATSELRANGGEQSFIMTRRGTTKIHCAIHPNMTGTLTVRDR